MTKLHETTMAKADILAQVMQQKSPVSVDDLVKTLRPLGHRETVVRTAIWSLIQDHTVRLTRNGQLAYNRPREKKQTKS